MSCFTKEEEEYMNYLDEVYNVEGYGLLLKKGSPIAFNVGLNEFVAENRQEEETHND